jgi:hypothetical protein
VKDTVKGDSIMGTCVRREAAVVRGFAALMLLIGLTGSVSAVPVSRFGFVSFTAAQASPEPGQPATFAGGVVVRFYAKNGREVLALTDEQGMALIPLHSGRYCAEAYGTDGKLLALDNRMKPANVCLDVRPGQIYEFSLTLASNVKYEKTVPSLGVD